MSSGTISCEEYCKDKVAFKSCGNAALQPATASPSLVVTTQCENQVNGGHIKTETDPLSINTENEDPLKNIVPENERNCECELNESNICKLSRGAPFEDKNTERIMCFRDTFKKAVNKSNRSSTINCNESVSTNCSDSVEGPSASNINTNDSWNIVNEMNPSDDVIVKEETIFEMQCSSDGETSMPSIND